MKKKSNRGVQAPKESVHFVHNELINPTNPIPVNLIGVGGTGSSMLMALARINKSLITLGHPGIQVIAYDPDRVDQPNLGRQLFMEAELGLNKAVAMVNRLNRAFGFRWKAVANRFSASHETATITISCVDNVATRMEIALFLREKTNTTYMRYGSPLYWMDFGNGKDTGQVILSTLCKLKQPKSKKYNPEGHLPLVTEEYGGLLHESENESTVPSCSLAEALESQDLFINSSLANAGASLVWNMFRKGMLKYRGFFLNLTDFRMQPIPVSPSLSFAVSA